MLVMGEYAEMMIDGTLCECCGTYMDDGAGQGFARYCSDQCARDRGAFHLLPDQDRKPKRKPRGDPGTPKACTCGTCGKSFKSKGARRQHRQAAHPSVAQAASEGQGL
jgi:hypothetical protein